MASLLGRVIEEYEKHHPAVTGSEVREAVRLAVQQSSRKGSSNVRLLAGLSAGVAVGGIFAFVAANHGQMPGDAVPMVGVAVAVFGVLALVAMLKARGG